jgi:hypothetical protein
MSRRRIALVLLALPVLALDPVAAADAAGAGGLSATVARTQISTELGRTFVVRSTISNHGTAGAGGVIVHLNVLSLRAGVYVDPEDWSTHRTRYLGRVAKGASTTISWRLKAVDAGAFGVYVAVLRPNGAARPPLTTPLVSVAVAGRKTLNAGGILWVALGVPAIVAAATAGLRLRRPRA